MANIKQQKKRNRRALEQRGRNLRYRSTIKTLFRRLDDAAEGGDGAEIEERVAAGRVVFYTADTSEVDIGRVAVRGASRGCGGGRQHSASLTTVEPPTLLPA